MLTPFLPHSAQKVHEPLGGEGCAAQPAIQVCRDLDDGPDYPVLTGDYTAAREWESAPVEVGRPLARPTPIFPKLDPKLGETGPKWAPIERCGPVRGLRAPARRRPGCRRLRVRCAPGGRPVKPPPPRRSRCRRPTVDAHTHLDACGGQTTPELLAAAMVGLRRSG